MRLAQRSRDGFTLIETLIVVGILGIVMVALAATFTVILRTQPTAEARTDDARTSLGLTTYLPEDVNSTPAVGFDRPSIRAAADAQTTGCAEDTDDGFSLLKLTWTETVGSTDTYIANYRLIDDAGGTRLVRYHCVNGGGESTINLTSLLPPVPPTWDPGELPFSFTLAGTDGVTVELTTASGESLALDARSNNPAETLPPSPPIEYPPIPDGNVPPTAPDVTATTQVGTAVAVATGASDLDGDAVILTPTLPVVSAVTPGWAATLSGLTYTVTPPALAPAGELATFTYTARDPYGQIDSGTVTVTLLTAPVNNPPVALDFSATVTHGSPTTIDLDLSPSPMISDLDSDPLTVSLAGVTDGLTVSVDPVTLIMTITSDGSDETPASFSYIADDGRGGTDTGVVTVGVIICKTFGATPLTPTTTTRQLSPVSTKRLKTDVVYTVKYTGPCNDLILWFDHDANGTFESPAFTGAVFVTDHWEATLTVRGPGGLKDWTYVASPGRPMILRNGVTGSNLATARLITTT